MTAGLFAQFSARRDEAAKKRQRLAVRLLATDGEEDRPHLAGRETQLVHRLVGRKAVGRRIEVQRGAPLFCVEPSIKQQHAVVAFALCRRGAAAFAVCAAHFEQVGKIVLEPKRNA